MSLESKSTQKFTAENLTKLEHIAYSVDKLGRHVLKEDVWVRYPGIETCKKEYNKGEILDGIQITKLEYMCMREWCYTKIEEQNKDS